MNLRSEFAESLSSFSIRREMKCLLNLKNIRDDIRAMIHILNVQKKLLASVEFAESDDTLPWEDLVKDKMVYTFYDDIDRFDIEAKILEGEVQLTWFYRLRIAKQMV
jgi:hypothetical protein